MSSAIVTSNFIEPHYIKELDEEGLTAQEIAISLGVEVFQVNQKLRREKNNVQVIQDWRVIAYTMLNENNGLQIECFALNTLAAKAFVARWSNRKGDAYLNYLFSCEKKSEIADKLIPKMLNEISDLRKKLNAMELIATQHYRKSLPSAKAGTLVTPIYVEDIFGYLQVQFRVLKQDGLDIATKLKAKINHQQKVIVGVANQMVKDQRDLFKEEAKEKNNLIQLIKKKP